MSLRLTVIGRDRLKSRLVNDCVERISADCMPELTIFTELVPVAVFLLLCLTYGAVNSHEKRGQTFK